MKLIVANKRTVRQYEEINEQKKSHVIYMRFKVDGFFLARNLILIYFYKKNISI